MVKSKELQKRGSRGKIRVSYPPKTDDMHSREAKKTSESGKKDDWDDEMVHKKRRNVGGNGCVKDFNRRMSN